MNFLGQDRRDVQYATKEASQKMTSPAETDLQRPKRIARYLDRGRLSGVALLRNRRSCGVRGLWLGWMFEYEKIYERWRGVGDGDGHEVFRRKCGDDCGGGRVVCITREPQKHSVDR